MHNTFQRRFLEAVLEKHAKKADAVQQLGDLLNLGKDAIYRRLRGDSVLSPDELRLISKTYHISLDSFVFDQANTVFFEYNAFSRQATDFHTFLSSILDDLEKIEASTEAHFYSASMEMPLFYYLYFPELTAFKLYLWGLTTFGFDYLESRPYSMDLVAPANFDIAKRIIQIYNRLPTTELICLGLVNNTLNHIEFIASIGKFADDEDALKLCDSVSALLAHLKNMAAVGKKFTPEIKPKDAQGASLELYHNELFSTNNTFLVSTKEGQMLYTTFGNPNFLTSTDQKLCKHTEEWLKTTANKSTSISMNAEKSRDWFFNQLERKVKVVRQRIGLLTMAE